MQLYNWGNYASPDLLKKIEDETGIKVTVTDYDGNDDALAKVEAGGGTGMIWSSLRPITSRSGAKKG